MTNVAKLQEKIERGQQAEEILRNPAWIAAGEEISRQFQATFKGDDLDAAMAARQDARSFEAFLSKFIRWQKEGQSAYKQVQELKNREAEGLSMDFNDIQGIA